jgi:hypothetical protein
VKNFQLDESLDDKDLAARCCAEGKCIVLRYPEHRKGQKDRVMLPALLEPGFPLVTLDHRIVEQNTQSIPSANGGIIVVKLQRPTRTMTTRIAADILNRFKRKFSAWSDVDWSRMYLELTEVDAYISPLVQHPDISQGEAVLCDDLDFGAKIGELLARYGAPTNAQFLAGSPEPDTTS